MGLLEAFQASWKLRFLDIGGKTEGLTGKTEGLPEDPEGPGRPERVYLLTSEV